MIQNDKVNSNLELGEHQIPCLGHPPLCWRGLLKRHSGGRRTSFYPSWTHPTLAPHPTCATSRGLKFHILASKAGKNSKLPFSETQRMKNKRSNEVVKLAWQLLLYHKIHFLKIGVRIPTSILSQIFILKLRAKIDLLVFKDQNVKRAESTLDKTQNCFAPVSSPFRRELLIIILDSSQGYCLFQIRQQMQRPCEEFKVLCMTKGITIPDTFMFIALLLREIFCFSLPRLINIPETQNNLKTCGSDRLRRWKSSSPFLGDSGSHQYF